MRAARECGAVPQLSFNVRPIASASVLGSFERRSALRENCRLARAEIVMAAELEKEIALEIRHGLFIVIGGYSKLSINEQNAAVDELTQIVRATKQFQKAEAAGCLIKIATGDGMALVFYQSPEAPVRCATELSRMLKDHPRLRVRMGIHSGPVSGVIDVTGKANVAGAGVNMAQRVMDCGDAGHILLSKHVAEDLENYGRWRPYLRDLGECEVKHGVRVSLVNFCSDNIGNPRTPEKLRQAKREAAIIARRRRKRTLLITSILLAALFGSGYWVFRRQLEQKRATQSLAIPLKSIAVLPFENLSASAENAFFADGVQDEILTNLARIADLKVISRTSVMQYKAGMARNARAIAQSLGVAHLLEGMVQRAAGKVRINAQLIDARNDTHLWGQTYDRDLADVFAIQTDLAKAIADQLRFQLYPEEKSELERRPTSNDEAFALYTQARTLLISASSADAEKATYEHAADLLDRAVARDPNFFLAYCDL